MLNIELKWVEVADELELIHKNHFIGSNRSLSVHFGFLVRGNQKINNGKSSWPLLKGTTAHAGDRQAALTVSSLVPVLDMQKDCRQAAAVGGFYEFFLPSVREGCVGPVDDVQDVRFRILRDKSACDLNILESGVLLLFSRTDIDEKNSHEQRAEVALIFSPGVSGFRNFMSFTILDKQHTHNCFSQLCYFQTLLPY